jgi:hypothetical protein
VVAQTLGSDRRRNCRRNRRHRRPGFPRQDAQKDEWHQDDNRTNRQRRRHLDGCHIASDGPCDSTAYDTCGGTDHSSCGGSSDYDDAAADHNDQAGAGDDKTDTHVGISRGFVPPAQQFRDLL